MPTNQSEEGAGNNRNFTLPSLERIWISPHCETTSRTPCTKVPENATSLFSGSKTVTFAISVFGWGCALATKFLTVAEADVAVGVKGGEMITK